MRIIEIHIYGYGKLENYKIPSLNRLQVFFGENEAGKSTIMSFIHSILFGFPSKQGNELRYEPRDNSKYGGKIKAVFPEKGIAVIERVKGKAAGDVTVTLEDGTVGGEELLKDLLQRMDKGIFQGIFSFNVHGLQNIQAMRGEELGKYLFSAGTLGTDKLFNAEAALLKEMELRFKPSGKKPLLNEKLKDLKEVQAALKNAAQQNERYSELLSERDAIERQIEGQEKEITELEQRSAKLKELKRNEHLVFEEASLVKKLRDSGSVSFPQDGLHRYEKLDQQLKPVHARMLWIEEKRISLLKEAESCKPDAELLEKEAEISSRVENLPLYDQLKQEKKLLELKAEEISEEISRMNDDLHSAFNEESIREINTSVFIKEQAESIQHHQQRLNDRQHELEAGFEEEKAALVEMESNAAAIKAELLGEEHRSQLKEDLALLENSESIRTELNQVKDQIIAHKARMNNEETLRISQKKKDLYQLLLLGGIFLLVFLWGFIEGQWLLSAAGIAGFVFLVAIYFRNPGNSAVKQPDQVLSELLSRERKLAELVDKQPGGDLFSIKNLLLKDGDLRQRHRELIVKIQQQSMRYEKVIQQFERWEAEQASLQEQKAALAAELGLKEEAGQIKIYDAFLLVEKLKQYFREMNRTRERLAAVSGTLEEMEGGLSKLAERFLQNTSHPPLETAALLKRKLRDAIEQKAKFNETIIKLKELNEEHEALEKDRSMLTQEIEALLAQADAENEDGFRIRAEKNEQIKKWSARLADVNDQLELLGITSLEREWILTGEALAMQIDANARLFEQHKQSLSDLFNRLANAKHSMKVLEEGGLYSELLHKYKQMKDEFEEEAKEWAKYAIAKELLSKTIDRYKDERMPRMLAKAESYLSHLTDGSYVRIIPQTSGSGFLIERNDHMLFEANELSQATAEQVYASIRLALAAVHHDRFPFPVIIDDSFVNFDHKRTGRTIELLREFSNNQILIFTCHRHLLDYFKEEEINKLEEKSTKIV